MEKKVAGFWSFVTGVPYRTYPGEHSLPPSLSAVSGAMSVGDITRNLAILESAGSQDIYKMRDTLILHHKKLLEAWDRQGKKMKPEDRVSSQLKSRFWGKGGLRLCAGIVKLIDLLGLDEKSLDDVIEYIGITNLVGLDMLDRISELTEMVVKVYNGTREMMAFDQRPDEVKEDDPDGAQHLVLHLDEGGWYLVLIDPFSGLTFRWPPSDEEDSEESSDPKALDSESSRFQASIGASHTEYPGSSSQGDSSSANHDDSQGKEVEEEAVEEIRDVKVEGSSLDFLREVQWEKEQWSGDVLDKVLALPFDLKLVGYQEYLSLKENWMFESKVDEAVRSGAVRNYMNQRERLKITGPVGKEIKWDRMHEKHERALVQMADSFLKDWQNTSGDGMLCLVAAANQATGVPAEKILQEARGYMDIFDKENPGLCSSLGVTLDSFFNVDLLLKLPCMAWYKFFIVYKQDGKTKLIIKAEGSEEIVFIRNLNNSHYENLEKTTALNQQENFSDMLMQWDPKKGSAMHAAMIRAVESGEK
jgi:hypothetical protein